MTFDPGQMCTLYLGKSLHENDDNNDETNNNGNVNNDDDHDDDDKPGNYDSNK